MREILFKAKRIDNGEWVEGYVVHKRGLYFIYDIVNSESCRQNNYEIDPETLCQFTGLCDKNGNKIWENDIFQCTDETMVTQKDLIEYNETHASFVRLRNTEKLGLQYL